jgi:hypothetical protein
VENNSHRGYFWDGWDIVRWVPNPSGYMSKDGLFKNNIWGMSYRSEIQNDGTWNVKAPLNVEHN